MIESASKKLKSVINAAVKSNYSIYKYIHTYRTNVNVDVREMIE